MKLMRKILELFIQLTGLAKNNAMPTNNQYDVFLGPESYKQVY